MGLSTKDFAQLCRNAGLDPMEQIRRLVPMQIRRLERSKYGVDNSPEGKAKRTCDDILFASEAEMRHYQSLKIAQSVGAISNLELQPRFTLQDKFTDGDGKTHRAIVYQADFSFVRDGKTMVIDVKGFPTPMWKAKQKMFLKLYPDLALEVWK